QLHCAQEDMLVGDPGYIQLALEQAAPVFRHDAARKVLARETGALAVQSELIATGIELPEMPGGSANLENIANMHVACRAFRGASGHSGWRQRLLDFFLRGLF